MHRRFVLLVVVALLLVVSATVALADVDPLTRTVSTDSLIVQFADDNPEKIEFISWKGSPNLTNTWTHPACPTGGDLEYFGNSWGTLEEVPFLSVVGWGTTGTWSNRGHDNIRINSTSEGCFGSAEAPVHTRYQFFEGGPSANKFRVHREFDFRNGALERDFNPYIPRLYPRDVFSLVLHPDGAGGHLLTEISANCEFGCRIEDWDGTWYAIHAPSTGQGMIVKHHPSPYDTDLWVEQDGGSFAARSSVLLIAPPGGFQGKVTETQTFCFYDADSWTGAMQAALILPPGC